MDYKKMWNTLKAESGGRWCQPHPCSTELLTIGELMRNMERRDETERAENRKCGSCISWIDTAQFAQERVGKCTYRRTYISENETCEKFAETIG
jgi:hypothetical protein